MIADFKCSETQRIHDGENSAKFPQDIQNVARRKLRMLTAAININDLRQPPGNRLEALRNDRAGQHSIRINDKWHVFLICFIWRGENALEVEIVNYDGIENKNDGTIE